MAIMLDRDRLFGVYLACRRVCGVWLLSMGFNLLAVRPGEQMPMYPFKVNREKALEVVLYISKHAPIPDRVHICKILYFADKYHMGKYARFTCGERYVAMQHGPVPSYTYDLIKAADQGEVPELAVDDFDVAPLRDPNVGLLSKSDIEALGWAINKFGNLSFGRLIDISHKETCWQQATNNGAALYPNTGVKSVPISIESILANFADGDELLTYLYEQHA
jgi:uncharacterized phage-associated protein